MGDLCKLDRWNNTVYRFDGFSAIIKETFVVNTGSSNTLEGISVYNGDLYVSEFNPGSKVYRCNGFSGTVVESFTAPTALTAIAVVNGDVYGTNYFTKQIYKHSGFSATVSSSWPAAFYGNGPSGLAFDGTNLISAGYLGSIVRYVGLTSTVDASFTPPPPGYGTQQNWGVTWDGTNVIVDWHDVAVQQDGFSVNILGDVNYNPYVGGNNQSDIHWLTTDAFTVSLQYKNASSIFVPVTASLGDTGADITPDASKTAYWDNPSQDRPNTEINDEVMRISAEPDTGNENTYTLAITNATQLVASDGTGSQGDVKVEYAFSQVYTPVLLLHMDGVNGSTSFPDSSSSAHTVTAFGNAQVSTASYKFGTGSALFDGSGDGLEIADDPGFNFDGAFTVELFARTTDFSGQGGRLAQLIAHGANGTAGNWLIYHSTSPNGVTIQFNGSNLASSAVMINDGDWHHVAMTRDGSNQIRLFIDGVLTTDVTNAADVTKATPLRIGANSPGVATWNGNIDEVRIIKGAAIYTGNFTPPTTPFS